MIGLYADKNSTTVVKYFTTVLKYHTTAILNDQKNDYHTLISFHTYCFSEN
jgi:hypothetical protein